MKTNLIILCLLVFSMPMLAQYRQVNLPKKNRQSNYKEIITENTGFWCAFETEGGSSIMETKTNMQFVNLSFTGGYRFNEYLRIGLGLGGRMYVNNADVRNTNS